MNVNHVMAILVMIALAATMLQGTKAKKYYRVGGDLGWTIPPGGAACYSSWASKHNFRAHRDLIGFDIKPGQDDLVVVTKENFDSCNTAEPLYQFQGPIYIGSLYPGTYYFTSSFAGHCAEGQKVAIYFEPSSNLLAIASPAPCPSSSAADESVATEHFQIRMLATYHMHEVIAGLSRH